MRRCAQGVGRSISIDFHSVPRRTFESDQVGAARPAGETQKRQMSWAGKLKMPSKVDVLPAPQSVLPCIASTKPHQVDFLLGRPWISTPGKS
jgi:hypothetical protein